MDKSRGEAGFSSFIKEATRGAIRCVHPEDLNMVVFPVGPIIMKKHTQR
jgi:hypothetical protein